MWSLVASVAFAGGWADIDTPARTGASAPGDAAVVVGIEDYLLVPDVPHARRDAQAFRDFLVYSRGVPPHRVQLLTDGGKESLEQAIARGVAEVEAGGTFWLYFAGHGAADPSTGARLLLGDDVRPDAGVFASRGLSVDAVTDQITKAKARGLLVLDTCYAGMSRDGESLVPGSRFLVPSYAEAPPREVTVWTGTSRDQLAMPIDAVRHGAFTYFAIGAMRGWADGVIDGAPDGQVTLTEAHEYVGKALRAAQIGTQQPDLQGGASLIVGTGKLEGGPDLASLTAPAHKPAPKPTKPGVTGPKPGLVGQAGALLGRPASGTLHHVVSLPPDASQELVLSTLNALGWGVLEQEPGAILARVPISLTSPGEMVAVGLEAADGGSTRVVVQITNPSPLALSPGPRNNRLAKRFVDRLADLERAPR